LKINFQDLIESETLELLEWPRLCQHLSTFAATKLGAIACRHLQIPATLDETQQLLAQTREVYQLESRLSGGLTFEGISDIGDSLERAKLQGILSGEELQAIAATLAGARQLRRTIDAHEDLPAINALVADLRTYPEIEREIHHCIDERGRVADRASHKLASIRMQMRQIRDRIYQILQGIMQRQANAIQEQLIAQRGDRFVIPVKAGQKESVPGIVHDTSMSGATFYVEPHAIVDLNNQMRLQVRQEQAEEEAIRRALSQQIAAVQPDLERLLATVTTVDIATARARYSLWLEANPPRFIDRATGTESQKGETVTLRHLRHPLLVWQQQHEQGEPVVPTDLLIQPHIRVVAITGPNTGGKTVTLKTLGLAALMAKAGLFVPAKEPVELPCFDRVLADIGDEQSIEQSLSTFSGHIRRITRILEAMTENSLVLLDEVGAGTDPSEGSALAIALLQHLASSASLTVATTHFGELKALKYQDDRFENASVEFDDVSLSPTYRLLWGIPGRSNALTIANRLGMPAEIVEVARTLTGTGSTEEINQVIAGLEDQRRRQETRAKEAAELVKQSERLHRELSQKAAQLAEREQQLKLSQEKAVQEAILTAKAEIAAVIRRLQQGSATAADATLATEALGEIADRHLPSRSDPPPKPKPGFRPQVGDRVRIPRLGQTAEVIVAPNSDGELSVRFGLMKMTVSLTDIESLDGEKPEMPVKAKPAPAPAPAPAALPTVRTSYNTLDLRGSRVSDAEIELDRAIAQAIPTSGAVWVIHGKGTGKLRQGVHDFLEQHPQVDRYELARAQDGGAGVTVVYLR
jgi:DNA mismatch repair protein MutS2